MPAAPTDHDTVELPATTVAPGPPPSPADRRSRAGRSLVVGLTMALLVALAAAAWQGVTAAAARDQVAALEDRLGAFEDDLADLRAENQRLRTDNEVLRAENERLTAEADDGLGALLGPLVSGELDETELLDRLAPLLRDRVGGVTSELGRLWARLGDGIGDVADGLRQRFDGPSGDG